MYLQTSGSNSAIRNMQIGIRVTAASVKTKYKIKQQNKYGKFKTQPENYQNQKIQI